MIDVASLVLRGERIGEARNATKADVFLVEDGGRKLVVKTLTGAGGGPRRALAGWLLRREGRLLARLSGTPGVPALVEATHDALVLEWRPGRTLFDLRKRGLAPAEATAIEAVVAGLHARGFAHGDVGRRDVLVAADGSASLVDFATAVGPGCPPLLGRLLLPLWRRRDAARVAKMLRRYRRRWDRNAARRRGRS